MSPRIRGSFQRSVIPCVPARRVVLLDEGWDVTLYVAVGLRDAGCTVHILTAAGAERVDAKYLGPRITREQMPLVRDPNYFSAMESALLRFVGGHLGSVHVLPLTESILYHLWKANPAWMDRVFPSCSPELRDLLCDKAIMSDYVAGAGARIPRQIPVTAAADADRALEELGLPVVVKGGTGCGGGRVRIAATKSQAIDTVAQFSASGTCFLQQYISGPTFLVGGLFYDGRPIRIYAGEKVECTHATGPSLRLRSVDDAALLDASLRIFQALRWTGLASVDIMRGPDGEIYFIEFNPRPWGAIAASAKCGVDLFGPFAQLLSVHLPAPDLSFVADIHTALFPQVAATRLCNAGVRSLACLLREPRIWLDAPWQNPGLVAHLSRRVWWNWRRGALDSMRSTIPWRRPRGADGAPALPSALSQSDAEGVGQPGLG